MSLRKYTTLSAGSRWASLSCGNKGFRWDEQCAVPVPARVWRPRSTLKKVD